MSATPQDVQALIDSATASLEKVTGRYNPNGKYWKPALADLAAARAEAGELVAPPSPVPPPPPPSGTVLFDGRASQMASMDSYETDQAHSNLGPVVVNGATYYYNTTQVWNDSTHPLWDCVCYGRGIGHNITPHADPHYGKTFMVTVKIGDTNQWGGSQGGNLNGAAQCSKRRVLHTDAWTWFAFGCMVPAWNGAPNNIYFCDLCVPGYQTSQGDQVALRLNGDSGKLQYAISQNAGKATISGGWAAGSVAYETPFLPVTFGQWDEFCIGVKAATDDTGEVQVYHRKQGDPWSTAPAFAHTGATALYGTMPNGSLFPQNIEGQGVIDKIGLYYGNHDQTVNQQTVYETGMVVCPDLGSAQGVF